MTVTANRAEARGRAHRRPVRRFRCPSGTQERELGPVHPGAGAQQVLHFPQGRRPDLLRRARLRARLCHAADTFPPTAFPQRSGPGVQAADHGGGRGHRDPGARRLPGALPRGEHAMSCALNDWQDNHWLDSHNNWHERWRGSICLAIEEPGGRRPRDRALGRAPVHGADPDQGRAAPVMGRPEVRPDLGRGHQARHHGELPPVPQPPRGAAHAAGRLPQLQPRLHGHLLAAGGEPGDEPDLRRGLRPLPTLRIVFVEHAFT